MGADHRTSGSDVGRFPEHRPTTAERADEPLTPAEHRILRYLATYRTLRQIATDCYVAYSTIKTHTLSVYRKLGVETRAEAVHTAIARGLLPPEGPFGDPDQPPPEVQERGDE